MFDKHMFSINNEQLVRLSKEILNDKSYKDYHCYHNKKVNLNTQTMDKMKSHYKTFLKKQNILHS